MTEKQYHLMTFIDQIMCGVALTDKKLADNSKAIFNYIAGDEGLMKIFCNMTLQTSYRIEGEKETETDCWIALDGKRLGIDDIMRLGVYARYLCMKL